MPLGVGVNMRECAHRGDCRVFPMRRCAMSVWVLRADFKATVVGHKARDANTNRETYFSGRYRRRFWRAPTEYEARNYIASKTTFAKNPRAVSQSHSPLGSGELLLQLAQQPALGERDESVSSPA